MKQIPIKNQWNVFALVDDDLYDKIISFGSWRLQQHGGYAVCGVKSIKMHWLVVEIPFGMEADHIDKNPIKVANQTITIPYSGAYGTAWSMDNNHLIGEL